MAHPVQENDHFVWPIFLVNVEIISIESNHGAVGGKFELRKVFVTLKLVVNKRLKTICPPRAAHIASTCHVLPDLNICLVVEVLYAPTLTPPSLHLNIHPRRMKQKR